MNYNDTKNYLSKNLDKIKQFFPGLQIDIKLFEIIFNNIECAITEKEININNDVLSSIKSMSCFIKSILIKRNLNEEEESLMRSLNSLLFNWAKIGSYDNIIENCKENNILFDTKDTLKTSIYIMRELVNEAKKIISFKPKDFEMSKMYLETIDDYYEILRSKGIESFQADIDISDKK